jgi:HAD superfamily hydrolase (TIGR01509 family)
LRAVIFDFDGVLVNSEPLHFRAMRDSLAPEGIAIDAAEYLRHYVAYDDRSAIRLALQQHGRALDAGHIEEVTERKARVFAQLKGEVPFFPGVRPLIRGLQRQVSLAIASGARCAEIEDILDAGHVRQYFTAIVGADDVSRTKPDPEPYLEALRRLRAQKSDLEASECVVVEDTPPGIAAGRAAGMTVVGVAHTYDAAQLTGAHHVVPSLRRMTARSLRALVETGG